MRYTYLKGFSPKLLILSFFSLLLSSCLNKDTPEMRTKEQDPRLIGIWQTNRGGGVEFQCEFRSDSYFGQYTITDGDYSSRTRSRTIFYTEGRRRLVFYDPPSFKYGSQTTYEYYKLLDVDRLIRWRSLEDMEQDIENKDNVYYRVK